jgi:hypothetical protein
MKKLENVNVENKKMIRLVNGTFATEPSYNARRRDPMINAVILDELQDIERKRNNAVTVDDMTNIHKVVIRDYRLPRNILKNNPTTPVVPLMIVLPDQYPYLPPIGFYLPSDIKISDHFYSAGYHGAPDPIDGFMWYCSSVISTSWNPPVLHRISDWRNGDSIYTVMTLINQLLCEVE